MKRMSEQMKLFSVDVVSDKKNGKAVCNNASRQIKLTQTVRSRVRTQAHTHTQKSIENDS